MPRRPYKSDLTAEDVRSVLSYDPISGEFRWKSWRPGRRRDGSAGCLNDKGYLLIRIDRRLYKAHRLAWLIMTGEWPSHDIDHEDEDHGNNRWGNLREATQLQNNRNISRRGKGSVSGYKGVWACHRGSRWSARITVNYQPIYLGSFETPQEAHAAYCTAADRLHGEFANHGKG